MIVLVDAGREQIFALASLHASCFQQHWSGETFDRLLCSPGTFALLASSDAIEVGFVLARVAADEAEILSVGVPPLNRRHGVATRLLRTAAMQAARAGAQKLFLEVAAENVAALALYGMLGFREVGRRPGYYREGSGDGLTMRADLPLPDLGKGTEVD